MAEQDPVSGPNFAPVSGPNFSVISQTPSNDNKKEEDTRPWYKKVLDEGKDLFNKANQPLTDLPGKLADYGAPALATAGVPLGVTHFLGQQANNFTSPSNLGMAALSGGTSALEKAGLETVPSVMRGVSRVASLPYAFEGANNVINKPGLANKVSGAAELALGAHGASELLPTGESKVLPNTSTDFTNSDNARAQVQDEVNNQYKNANVGNSTPVGPEPQKLLPGLNIKGALPAKGETYDRTFYSGPAGLADSKMAYPYDISDQSRPRAQTISSGEPGVQAPNDIGPIQAANRTNLGMLDKAQNDPAFAALVPNRLSGIGTKPLGIQGVPKEPVKFTNTPSGILPKEIPNPLPEQKVGGEVVTPPNPNNYGNNTRNYDPNKIDVTNRQLSPEAIASHHTPEAISSHIDNASPEISQGLAVKPSPQQINSVPVNPAIPSDVTTPRAGMATVTRDVGIIPAEFNSLDTTLLGHPLTSDIYQPVVDAETQFNTGESRAVQDYAKLTKGLTVPQLEDLGHTLNGEGSGDPQIKAIADQVKQQVFEPLYGILPEGTGKFENYFPHVAKEGAQNYYDTIKSYFLGDKLEPNADASGGTPFNRGTLGNTDTPFTKERTDRLNNIEWNANKTVPLYIHSVLRDAFLSPAVEEANKQFASLPDSAIKGILGAALKNVTNFNGEGELGTKWNELANTTSNTIARAVYSGNVIPHILHASNLLTQIYPELGEKYTAIALDKIAKNPSEAFNEVTRNGLISGNQLPWNLKSGMQKFDSIGNFGSFIERFNAAVAYYGSKQRFLDQGLPEQTAQLRAMQATKKMNLVTTPATATKALSSQSKLFGSFGAKVGGLGAKAPTKFVENLIQTAMDAQQNKAKLARTVAVLGALTSTFGPGVIHHAGTLLNATPLGSIAKVSYDVFSKVMKGDIPGAIEAGISGTASHTIPGATGISDTIKLVNGE